MNGVEDHGGTKGGKNHLNYFKKLSVQEILEKLHYVSVIYTQIQHHQPIKSVNAHLSIEYSILVPGRKGKLCPCPRYSGTWFLLAGATPCSALMISNCNWHIWEGCWWWCFKKQEILLLKAAAPCASKTIANCLKYVLKYPWFNLIPPDLFSAIPNSFQIGLVEPGD